MALFLLRSLLKDSGAARQAVASGAIPQVLAALNLSMGREIQCLWQLKWRRVTCLR